jgi:carbon storage regulator
MDELDKGGPVMLVLSRKKNQVVVINGDVRVIIAQITGRTVRLAVEAPPHVSIDREEIAVRKGTRPRPGTGAIGPKPSAGHLDNDLSSIVPAT